MIRALAAGICFAVAASAAAQSAPDWLRDLPSVADVQQRIRGANTAQTLGRQCAVLTRLERGDDVPGAFKFNPTPAMAAVAESYRAALRDLELRYNDTVKPLADVDNRREWDRMCGNRRSGFHPATGEPDPGFPALDEPVSEADFVALFGPAAHAAYEAEREARRQRSAAMDRQREAAAAEMERRNIEDLRHWGTRLVIMIGAPLLAIAALIAMVRALRRTRWQPGPGSHEVRLRSSLFAIHDTGGVVLDCKKDVERVYMYVRERDIHGNISLRKEWGEIVHWTIRYGSADGKTHELKLDGWKAMQFAEGDVLQVFYLRRNGKTSTPALIVNRTTDGAWHDSSVMHRRLVPLSGLFAFPLVVAAGFLTGGIGWLIGFWWMRAAKNKAARYTADVLEWLKTLPPPASVATR
jgi:hypothetical protein